MTLLCAAILLTPDPAPNYDGRNAEMPGAVRTGDALLPFPAVNTLGSPPRVATGAVARHRWFQRLWWGAIARVSYRVTLNYAAAVHRSKIYKIYKSSQSSAGHRGPAIAEPVTGRCGGDLPPCSVMMCESGGDIRAENPTSTASGKWQILDSTWDGFGGYGHAADAPEWVQDEKARQLYDGGRGRHHWVC